MNQQQRERTPMTATTSQEDESVQAVVQPSSHLMNILHRKLRDPGIVPAFERHRARHSTEGLMMRPRWALLQLQDPHQQHGDVHVDVDETIHDAGDGKDDIRQGQGQGGAELKLRAATTTTVNNNDTGGGGDNSRVAVTENIHDETSTSKAKDITSTDKKCNYNYDNAIPKRNYIDLRMEQNRRFADDQCLRCQKILSTKLQLEKKKKEDTTTNAMIESLINEGLAACPNHEGLLNAMREYKGSWLTNNEQGKKKNTLLARERGQPITQNLGLVKPSSSARTVTVTNNGNGNKNNGPNPNQNAPTIYHHKNRKGAGGRAQAAMRDALLERSFLLGGDSGNKKEEDGNKYPLLTEAAAEDDALGGEIWAEKVGNKRNDDDESDDSTSGSGIEEESRSRRRRRKKSKRKHKKHGKRGKSRKRHRRSSHRRRSRSESRSRTRSHSSGRSMSSSSSSEQTRHSLDRRRKHRRKDHRERRGRESRRRSRSSKRYRSDDDDDEEGDNDNGNVKDNGNEQCSDNQNESKGHTEGAK